MQQLQLFMIFKSFETDNKVEYSSGCLIVTCDDIIVAEDLTWLFVDNDEEFVVSRKQPMMNLVEIVSGIIIIVISSIIYFLQGKN